MWGGTRLFYKKISERIRAKSFLYFWASSAKNFLTVSLTRSGVKQLLTYNFSPSPISKHHAKANGPRILKF